MSKIWKHPNGFYSNASSHYQTLGVQRLGLRFHPSSSKGHRFVLVATEYFTKWTKDVPLKNMTHKEVIEFITEHIIHRFSIP
jgi:hypothetical protein